MSRDGSRRHGQAHDRIPEEAPRGDPRARRGDLHVLRQLLPYLWADKSRVVLALACLVGAKLANVGVPIVLKQIVDGLSPGTAALAVPIGLLVLYGLLRMTTTTLGELREIVFARVTQASVRALSLRVFEHLHRLSLRFHLERQTGGLTRDIERGSRGIGSLVSFTLYSILPTIVEIALVLAYLVIHYDASFALITLAALVLYVTFTIRVTEWRTHLRRAMNDLDSRANVRAIDSLINYETVKYFNNEAFEASRYDEGLRRWQAAAVRSQVSLAGLNIGQAMIIAIAVTLIVWRATVGVVDGRMTLGDLVLVNAFMIQLYAPLNFLGVLYREIKQSLTDVERMFTLLAAHREIQDAPGARPLPPPASPLGPAVRFEDVRFAYHPDRPILRGLDIDLPPGSTAAVVGPSGAGKSTLARLLFRFYDVDGGRITIDGQDIRQVTQASLRAAIGIVPQDTVLFNDTIRYNVAYGRPQAGDDEVRRAITAARLDALIDALPEGDQTQVGERGLKLSGGEKQRVAIARMLLKNPSILVLDEATSALDTRNEQAIQQALNALAAGRTTLIIAHRLSTIVDADQILVMDQGRIVERGPHAELLARDGLYARMWQAQAQAARPSESTIPARP